MFAHQVSGDDDDDEPVGMGASISDEDEEENGKSDEDWMWKVRLRRNSYVFQTAHRTKIKTECLKIWAEFFIKLRNFDLIFRR